MLNVNYVKMLKMLNVNYVKMLKMLNVNYVKMLISLVFDRVSTADCRELE